MSKEISIKPVSEAESWYIIQHDLLDEKELFDNFLLSLDELKTPYGAVMKELIFRVLNELNHYDDEEYGDPRTWDVEDRELAIVYGDETYSMNVRLLGKINDNGEVTLEDTEINAAKVLSADNKIYEFRIIVYPKSGYQKNWSKIVEDDVVIRGIFQVGGNIVYLEKEGLVTLNKYVFGVFDKANFDSTVEERKTIQMARLLDNSREIQKLIENVDNLSF